MAVGFTLRHLEAPEELNEVLFSDGIFFPTAAPAWFAPVVEISIGIVVSAWLGALRYSGWRAFFDRLESTATLANKSEIARWRRLAVRVVLALLFAIIFLPVAGAYFKIAFPMPIPHVESPDPNGYLVLAKLGAELEQADILTLDSPSDMQIRDFVDANRQRLETAPAALELPHIVPVRYGSAEILSLDSLGGLRQLARRLVSEGKVAALDGRPDAAAAIDLDVMRLGQIAGQGGFYVDLLVGVAIEGIGRSELCRIRRSISPETARQLIEALQRLDARRESPEEVGQREAAWQQHAYGWARRIIFDAEDFPSAEIKFATQAAIDRTRLLICDLAIGLYRAECGTLPERLEQLTPKYLRELPIDPFSGRPFAYRPVGDKFLLYSVGPDGKDDGGKPTENNALIGEGDLVLEP